MQNPNDSRNVSQTLGGLIESRCAALGVCDAELVRLCGYKNVAKGLRRLQMVREGELTKASQLIGTLPTALGLRPEDIEHAVLATQLQQLRDQENQYRETFRPHGTIVCERSRPEPLFVAAVIGVDRLLRIDFAAGSAPITYVRQALDTVSERLRRWNSPAPPAFARPKSIIVNYKHDQAVEFTLDGQPLRLLENAARTDGCSISLGARPISYGELEALIGSQ